jgi:uncharacterized protein YbbK (DUF523 family)
MNILVSGCLLGICCRYNGTGKLSEELAERLKEYHFIPVCPEQLGGLTTPRLPAEKIGDKVLLKDGRNVTEEFIQGAKETLKLALMYDCKLAILKERSPSCGFGKIYDGNFTGQLIDGNGVTAEILSENGVTVIGESKINELEDIVKNIKIVNTTGYFINIP